MQNLSWGSIRQIALALVCWVAEPFSLPDVAVSPEPKPPGVELYNLRMVNEQVHILSECFQVPFEHRRVRCFEHPSVIAELIHELLDNVLAPSRRRKVFCDSLRFEHKDAGACVQVRSGLFYDIYEASHLSLVADYVSSCACSYHHLNLRLGLEAQLLDVFDKFCCVLQLDRCYGAVDVY